MIFNAERHDSGNRGQVSFHTFDATDSSDRDNDLKPVYVKVDVKPDYRPVQVMPVYKNVFEIETNSRPNFPVPRPSGSAQNPQYPQGSQYLQNVQYPQGPLYPQHPQYPQQSALFVPSTFGQLANSQQQPAQYPHYPQLQPSLVPQSVPQYVQKQQPQASQPKQEQSQDTVQAGALIYAQEASYPNLQPTQPPQANAPENVTVDGLAFTTESSLIPINCLKSLCG